MTLDISQFIANSVRAQSKVHHLDINVKAVKVDEVPKSVKTLITDDYGEKYLEDADYVAFFWGSVNKDNIDKLFNVVDKALGKSANKLTDKDFKKINIAGSKTSSKGDVDDESDAEEEIDIDIEESSTDNDETIEADDEEQQLNEDDDNDDDIEDDSEDDSEDEEISDEDDEDDESYDNDEETVEVAVEEKPEIPTSYFFLKITSK